jgi:hypothetical protein
MEYSPSFFDLENIDTQTFDAEKNGVVSEAFSTEMSNDEMTIFNKTTSKKIHI